MAINNSKITIQFNTNLTFGEYISFDLISKNVVVSRFTETWNFLRTSNFTVPVLELYYLGQYMSDAFKMQKYFNIDYNSLNQFLVTAFEDTITIESTNPSWSFANFETNSDATATTTQLTSLDDFELTTSEAVESIDNCNYVDINLVSSLNIKKYILNNVETVLNNTNLNITFPRGEDFKIQLFDDNDRIIYYPGQTIHNSFLTFTEKLFVINKSNNYNKLLESNITPNVNVSINGATVQIVVLDADDLDLEYSLNNVNYQESNIFTGQAAGNYTVYVKDKFNCVKSKQYVVDEIGTREPYYYISKINPFNFVKVEDIDNVNTFSNDDNSLNKEGFELNKFFPNRHNKMLDSERSFL